MEGSILCRSGNIELWQQRAWPESEKIPEWPLWPSWEAGLRPRMKLSDPQIDRTKRRPLLMQTELTIPPSPWWHRHKLWWQILSFNNSSPISKHSCRESTRTRGTLEPRNDDLQTLPKLHTGRQPLLSKVRSKGICSPCQSTVALDCYAFSFCGDLVDCVPRWVEGPIS